MLLQLTVTPFVLSASGCLSSNEFSDYGAGTILSYGARRILGSGVTLRQDIFHCSGGLIAHAGQHMGVRVEGYGYGGVA